MATARRLAPLGALLAIAWTATGCGSFGSAEEPAASDASAPEKGAGEAGLPPAGLDGGAPGSCTEISAKDDFNGGFDLAWITRGTGSVAPEAAAQEEFLRALIETDELAYLERNVEGCGELVTAKTRMRIYQEGDGEVDLFRFQLGASGGVVALVHTPDKHYMIEAPDHGLTKLPFVPNEWTDVSIELDLALHEFTVTAGTNRAQGKLITPVVPLEEISLQVGIAYAGGVKSRWQVDYDSVEISARPK